MPQQLVVIENKGALATEAPKAARYAENAWSKNTRRTYDIAWRRFQGWCEYEGRSFPPKGAAGLQAFIEHMAALGDAGLSWSTIAHAASALSQGFQLIGEESPLRNNEVRLTLRGLHRSLMEAPQQAKPITPKQIRHACETIFSDVTPRNTRDRAVLCLGFAGAFRRSELTGLTLKDIKFHDDQGLLITLRKSKTDQAKKGRVIGIPYGARRSTCPVRNLQAWLALLPKEDVARAEGPLFREIVGRPDREKIAITPMSDRAVARLVQRATPGQTGYSGHSLRAGFVTEAYKQGKQIAAIKKQTGHKSVDMLHRYIREEDAFKDNAAEGLL